MRNKTYFQKIIYYFGTLSLLFVLFVFAKLEAEAVDFPDINVSFDPTDESVIVEGIPGNSADGMIEYQLEGYLKYEKERIETFCYAPNVKAYDVADNKAYIFNWSGDAEFLLPCSGDYQFTAYVTARYIDLQGNGVEEKGPKTTITISLHKKDESTNWGPGLPNTTVETYDLNQIKGKDKTIKVEEADYTWSIHGEDIANVPEKNLSLKVIENPDTFQNSGIDDFFGDTPILKLSIEHNGEFGFEASLAYKLGEQYAGKYANLFYVVGDGTFECIGNSFVEEDGIATFVFTHASDYVVAIMEEEYTGQRLNTTEQEEVREEQADSEKEALDREAAEIEEKIEATVEPTPEAKVEAGTNVENLEIPTDEENWFVIGGIACAVLIIIIILLVSRECVNKSL